MRCYFGAMGIACPNRFRRASRRRALRHLVLGCSTIAHLSRVRRTSHLAPTVGILTSAVGSPQRAFFRRSDGRNMDRYTTGAIPNSTPHPDARTSAVLRKHRHARAGERGR
jgi:hypothetical protein